VCIDTCLLLSILEKELEDALYKTRILFVGNPGVGKSTLLNSLIGGVVFKSGLSPFGNTTSKLQWYEHSDNIVYGDTPGLSHYSLSEATHEIYKALKVGGLYKLVFICSMESGGVSPEKIETLRLVLDAINDPNFPYGIIINKVSPRVRNFCKTDPQILKMLKYRFKFNERSPTENIFLYPFDERLYDEDNALADVNIELQKFINMLPSHLIIPDQVSEIRDYDLKSGELMKMKVASQLFPSGFPVFL
jgi:GTP-binding protein EngB required for normal cell division